MNIEKELFKKAIVDFTKLEKYGFTVISLEDILYEV